MHFAYYCRDLVNEYKWELEINQIYSLFLIVTNYCVIYCRHLFASPHGPLSSTTNCLLCHFRGWTAGYESRRSSVENRVENLPINFDKEWHAHSCLTQLSFSKFCVALRRDRARARFLLRFWWSNEGSL